MCDLHICRICLNTAVRGYKLEEYNLRNYYEYAMREKLSSKDVLPQWVCYECATMLHKFHKFKEKCLRGQFVLKQLSFREKITYESVAMINRHNEKLISSLEIARTTKLVQTKTLKYKRNLKIKSETIPAKHFKAKAMIDNNQIKNDSFNSIRNTHIDIPNNNFDITDVMDNVDDIDHSTESDDEKPSNEDIIKHESLKEEEITIPITQPSADPIKSEFTDSIEVSTHLNISSLNKVLNTNNHEENITSDLDNTNDLDTNFDIADSLKSSDDESLVNIAKKKMKVKRKMVNKKSASSTRKESKEMKTKNVNEKEVVLKNTLPLKLVLSPQFWKKINLSEDEAVREFKQREFNNDYYLKAKYKCHNCFKGFSRHDMLDRHLKQRHDESCGSFECRFCHQRFRHKHQLRKHIGEHLVIYNCLLCKLQCSRLSSALQHQEHHKGTKKTCKHCGKEFNHLSTYYTHVRMSHRSAHVCVACGASFVSEHGLLMHARLMHADNVKQLEEEIRKRREASSKTGTGTNETNEQLTVGPPVNSAPDSEEIYCEKCDIKFMSRRAYNIHFYKSDNHDDGDANAAPYDLTASGMKRLYAKIPTTCPHCNKGFPTRVAYQRHHLSEHKHIPLVIPKKRDICEVCGASVQMGSIQYHMKSHTGEREFLCPASECGLRFTLKRNMQRHYNVKHLGMPTPKYVRRNPGKRKKKTQDILDNDFSPFVRSRTGYFL